MGFVAVVVLFPALVDMFSCPVHGRPLSAGRQICGAPVRGPLRASYGLGRRGKSTVRMAMVAPSVEYDVVKVDGTSEGVETLSLKVADQDKAKGLVHRYLVKVRRDMRQVGWAGVGKK